VAVPQRAPGGFPVVGVIGAGQLARMMVGPAAELGITLSVLSESSDASAALVTPSAPVGGHDDLAAVLAFARNCDVVTFDHEHVPPGVLAALLDAGAVLRPSPAALVHAQDKIVMRRRLRDLGVPCPRWAVASTGAQVAAFGAVVGWPIVAKAPRGGYDGKGVLMATGPDDLADWLAQAGTAGPFRDGLLVEEAIAFRRELAVLVARSPSGQAAAWPVTETIQTDGVCTQAIAPAAALDHALAAEVTHTALRVAGALDVTGVLAVELFEVDGEHGRPTYLVNELAMRPHNSGHWTMDGAVTGQFEQHLRAVLDLPLGDPSPRQRFAVMANVLGGDDPQLYPAYRHVMARDPGLRVHLYGKAVRAGRKIGHVTVCGEDLADLVVRADHAAGYLRGTIRE
jgi:5-(carboxyamino)imidazole ribonucleotide synthase